MEPFRPVVCRGDPKETGSPPSRSFELAMASVRGFCEDQRQTHYLWRAVDLQGEVLESYVTKRRDRNGR
jgi:hypothetical protein